MDAERLASIPLFSALSERERRQIAQWADEIEVEEGRELAKQGQFGYEFFVIEDGHASVLRDGETIRELGPGDFFGEMGLVGHEIRSASVAAVSPLTAIVMTGRDFRLMAHDLPAVGDRIRAAIEERARALSA